MGFPLGYTRQWVPKFERRGQHYDDVRLSLIGSSWHVGVVVWLLAQLCSTLRLHGSTSSAPGGHHSAPPGGEVQLFKKCLGLTSGRGEDMMVQPPLDPRCQMEALEDQKVGVRFLHLADSLVCLHALTRGQSSTQRLRPIMRQLCACILPLSAYIHTYQNPAD